jgi:ubiquinone/menaquinone biosynthesis C-methylase UbiE
MKRIIEPELMRDKQQAAAYANANFEEPHNHFVELLSLSMGENFPEFGNVIDLGTGAADIAIRFASNYPCFEVDAIDGSCAMIAEGKKALDKVRLNDRINLIHSSIQDITLAEKEYAIVFSNSLLHHLHDPMALWELIKNAKGNPLVFIMDLMRPKNIQKIDELVHKYAGNEPEILQKDFKNSLKAAFTPEEVVLQLQDIGLDRLKVTVVSDRHIVVNN